MSPCARCCVSFKWKLQWAFVGCMRACHMSPYARRCVSFIQKSQWDFVGALEHVTCLSIKNCSFRFLIHGLLRNYLWALQFAILGLKTYPDVQYIHLREGKPSGFTVFFDLCISQPPMEASMVLRDDPSLRISKIELHPGRVVSFEILPLRTRNRMH